MYIEKIKIGRFGALADREIELSPGMNIVEGRNESGKSTVASFIKFVLYGMKGIEGADRHMSWDGSAASGSLTVVADGRRIAVERRAAYAGARGAVRETVRATDLGTGLEVYAGQCPGEALFGVPEDVFTGTAFVRQMEGTGIDGGKLSAAAENLLFSADEAINTEKAAERIDLLRRQLLYKNGKGGAIYEKTAQLEALRRDLDAAKRASTELINVDAQIADLEKKRDASKARCEDVRRRITLCDCAMKLRMTERKKSLLDEADSVAAERVSLAASDARFGGVIPDGGVVQKTRGAADAMEATSRSIASAARNLDDLRASEAEYADEGLYGVIESSGGVDGTVSRIEGISQRRGVFAVLAAVMAVLGGAFAVMSLMGGMLSLIFIAAAAVFFAAAAAFAVVSVVSAVKFRRELRRFGAHGKADLRECVEDAADDAAEQRELKERIAAAEAELYVQYSVYDEEKAAAREMLAGFGADVADDDMLTSVLRGIASAAETMSARDASLRAKIASLRGEASELERRLSGVDEQSLREALEGCDINEYDETAAARLRREGELADAAHQRVTEALHELEIKRTQLAATRTEPAAISAKLDTLARSLDEDKQRYESCVLATEALAKAGQGVRESVAPRLRETAREYLGRVSDGKYTELGVDAKFGVTVSADGAYRDLGLLSGGTVDAAYLSLRLALVRLLFRREQPPLIFDEAFSRLDDARAGALLGLIASADGVQSLIMTCQRRERELASSIPGGARTVSL